MRDALVGYLGGLGPIGIVSTADLLPALLVGCYYIVRDARFRALDARPFLVLTLATGSLGRVASSSIRNGTTQPRLRK